VSRPFQWINMALAILVVIGVFAQLYLIGAYIFSGQVDTGLLDAHENLGHAVHGIEVVVFLAAIPAFWRRWSEIGWSLALAVIGSAQIGFASGGEWSGGFHALFALLVLILAAIITHRDMRFLGLGRHDAPGAPRTP
jgi:hypothetical protein